MVLGEQAWRVFSFFGKISKVLGQTRHLPQLERFIQIIYLLFIQAGADIAIAHELCVDQKLL